MLLKGLLFGLGAGFACFILCGLFLIGLYVVNFILDSIDKIKNKKDESIDPQSYKDEIYKPEELNERN